MQGLFNFKPSVRPVPLECHIQGYPGKFYCPRMATMNKPAYAAIQTHSPLKPVLVFVSSRRQVMLQALHLWSCIQGQHSWSWSLHLCGHDDKPAHAVAHVSKKVVQGLLQQRPDFRTTHL